MKTLVEFFDTNSIENVNALLRFTPDKVVFVGFKNTMNSKRKAALEIRKAIVAIKSIRIVGESNCLGR